MTCRDMAGMPHASALVVNADAVRFGGSVFVRQRTCRYVGDEVSGGCSEFRGWLDPGCSYCPSCGAKVVM